MKQFSRAAFCCVSIVLGLSSCASSTDTSYVVTRAEMEKIAAEIKSKTVKDVILDSDEANEMDDQYALAYCLGHPRINLLSVNAALWPAREGFAAAVEKSYNEIERVLDVCGALGKVPVYRGCTIPVSNNPDLRPSDSPATRNIIRAAHRAKGRVYVLTTGVCTNVASAIMIDPTIKKKLVVLWLGTNCFGWPIGDYNMRNDFRAGQILLNSGVPLLLFPANGPDSQGSCVLAADQLFIKAIKGDGRAQMFFRKRLPSEFHDTSHNWWHILWDLAAPAALSVPEAMQWRIIPSPVATDSAKFATDSTRHPIIYVNKMDPKQVRADAFASISKIK